MLPTAWERARPISSDSRSRTAEVTSSRAAPPATWRASLSSRARSWTYPRQPGVEDSWTTTFAMKFLFKYHPRLMMINLPEVDIFGHIAGTKASVIQPLISNVDHQIGRLVAAYGRAGLLGQTDWIIVS